jgi:hypothetical protein
MKQSDGGVAVVGILHTQKNRIFSALSPRSWGGLSSILLKEVS